MRNKRTYVTVVAAMTIVATAIILNFNKSSVTAAVESSMAPGFGQQDREVTRDDRLDPGFDARKHIRGKLRANIFEKRFTESPTLIGTLPGGLKLFARAHQGDTTCTATSCDLDYFVRQLDGTEVEATLHGDDGRVARSSHKSTTTVSSIVTCHGKTLCFYIKETITSGDGKSRTVFYRDCFEMDTDCPSQ
jgi:hypothetical protein